MKHKLPVAASSAMDTPENLSKMVCAVTSYAGIDNRDPKISIL
ncbi:hypothetical protein [Congregicoccus parvus]